MVLRLRRRAWWKASPAEGPLVDEAKLGIDVVREPHPDPEVLLVGCCVRLDEQLAAHAEVGQDRLVRVLQGQPEVLPAAARGADAAALEAVREVIGTGEVTADRARVQHLGLGDRTVGDPPREAPPYDLDLGQLGHGALPSRTGV
jgi:hypothetical protein